MKNGEIPRKDNRFCRKCTLFFIKRIEFSIFKSILFSPLNRLLNTFGISRLQVEGIKGEEEKQQFIVKELTERIKEQYE